MNISVLHADSDCVPNPNPKGETPFEEFWRVRSSILTVCQRFGTTGPESGASSLYYLIDDQYNDELWQFLDVGDPDGWTLDWLVALIHSLNEHHDWGIKIAVADTSHVLVFADRAMVCGPAFTDCHDLGALVHFARIAATEYEERKNGPLRRQLIYIQRLLTSAMQQADANRYAYIATFNGYQLHEGHSVWLLQKTRDLRPDADHGLIHTSAVTADGAIHPQYCKDFAPYTHVQPQYWLLANFFEDKSIASFKLIDNQDGYVGSIDIFQALTDEEVKRLIDATKNSSE